MEKINKLKILFFTQYFWPENFRINDVALYLKKKKHEIKILTNNPCYPEKKIFSKFYLDKEKYKKLKGIEIFRIPSINRGKNNILILLNYINFFFNSFIFGISKFLNKKIDFVFIFCPSPILSALPAIILKKIFKKKVVIWVLDLWPDTLIDLQIIKNKWLIKILKYLVGFIYDNCDLILVQSESFKKEISKVTKSKCIYFSSWAEENIGNNIEEYAKEISRKEKKLKIVFTGNIGEAQSFESIIKCANLLKKNNRIKWIIIGNGRWQNKLQKMIKKNNLEKNFQLIDNVPVTRIRSFLNHADALLISLKNKKTFKKTIPGKLQTYMASGKPIIGMISGEANKIIKKSKSGLVCEADNYKALKNLLIKFNKMSKEKRKVLGVNGKKFANKYFNKTKNLNELEKILIKHVKKN